MKKYIYILVMSLAVGLLSGCEDTDDVFGKSPEERIQEAITTFEQVLLSPEYGWEMRYFSTENSAGYPLLVKFYKDSKVVVAGQNRFTNNSYKKSESYYDVIDGNGALLTFETYNEVLHAFSNPVDPNGKGQEGDYEFYCDPSLTTDNQVVLIGKKRGLSIVMTKLDKKYSDWSVYFNELAAINKVTFEGNAGAAFHLKVAGAGPYLTYNEYQFFQGNTAMGFILTPSGLHLYEGYERNGQLAVNFQLDNAEAPTKFVCTDEGVTASIEPRYTPLASYQMDSKTNAIWTIDYKTMGASSTTAFNALQDALKATDATIKEVDLLYVQSVSKNALRFRYRIADGTELEALIYYNLTYTPSKNPETVTFTYNDANENGLGFLKRAGAGDVEAGKALVNAVFAKTYKVECASGGLLNPSYLKFIATDDKDCNFTIHKKNF